jgi:heme oxygenase
MHPTTTDAASPSVMVRLREQTRAHHDAAESRELQRALAKGQLPIERYQDWLGQRLLMHRALESRVRRLAEEDPRVAAIAREELYQEGNLLADLAHFKFDTAGASPLPSTGRFLAELDRYGAEQPLGLLGAYYVFEGSKNGAAFLVKALRQAYGLADGAGLRYLDPHGPKQRPLWQSFKQSMDAAGFDEPETRVLVAAAQRTFELIAACDDELYAA